MEDRKGTHPLQRLRRLPVGILVTLATLVLASGGGAAWFTWRALNPTKPPVAEFPTIQGQPDGSQPPAAAPPAAQNPAPAEQPAKEPTQPAPATETTGQVYWVKDVDGRLALAPQSVTLPGDSADKQLQSAFETLLSKAGDPAQAAVTTIPEKTQLLSLTVESDGVHVDLSESFESGGGSASMTGRLAQVVYTATALDPTAPVWIAVEGKPLTLLGGEGIEVSQPMTREAVKAGFDL